MILPYILFLLLGGISSHDYISYLQAIATRVSTGDECSIIIEDGYVVKDLEAGKAEAPAAPTWKAGVF